MALKEYRGGKYKSRPAKTKKYTTIAIDKAGNKTIITVDASGEKNANDKILKEYGFADVVREATMPEDKWTTNVINAGINPLSASKETLKKAKGKRVPKK